MDNENYKTIEISFKSGHTDIWDAEKGEWDDYAYDGQAIIIKKNESWVGIYNFDCILGVVVK